MNTNLRGDIATIINKHSAENASGTPDYILANYLILCLDAFDVTTQQRETWHGRDASPTETTR